VQTLPEPLPSTALPLFTVGDAAEMLGVSQTYVYDQIRDGGIPAVDLGTAKKSKFRIRADHLQQFIQDRTTQATASGAAA
jgi:excisionase family DNA binding protein